MTRPTYTNGAIMDEISCMEAMGIPVWVRRANHSSPRTKDSPDQPYRVTEQGSEPPLSWEALQHRVETCQACGLHQTRTQTVFGTGDSRADCLFVGEAPGADEDRLGEPFVGRAGQLLNAMLQAMGFSRDQVYIANVLKCRPPGNRDPRPEEVECCEPFLLSQIRLIQPRVIVALGRHAAHSLTKTELPLARLRGQRLHYHGIPLVATYHPAYLLRNPADKKKSWDDLRLTRRILSEKGIQ